MSAVPFLRTPTERERRSDIVLAAVMFVGAVLSAGLSSIAEMYGDEQAPLWTALVYAVAVTAPLAVRRRWPGTVAVIVVAAYFTAVTIRIPEIYVGNIAMFIAIYTAGAWMNNRRQAIIVRVASICVATSRCPFSSRNIPTARKAARLLPSTKAWFFAKPMP